MLAIQHGFTQDNKGIVSTRVSSKPSENSVRAFTYVESKYPEKIIKLLEKLKHDFHRINTYSLALLDDQGNEKSDGKLFLIDYVAKDYGSLFKIPSEINEKVKGEVHTKTLIETRRIVFLSGKALIDLNWKRSVSMNT